MQVYHFNHARMSENDVFAAALGTRNKEGIELYKRLMQAGAYDLVAEVEGNNLEQAWIKTQNGIHTDSWSLEPLDGMTPLGLSGDLGHRSSMVGDIVVVDDVMHVADAFGFTEVGPVDPSMARGSASPKP